MSTATGHRTIEAITFDLDDTLWDAWPTIERAEQRLHDWLAEHYPRIAERFSPVELRDLRQTVAQQADLGSMRREGLKMAARAAGYERFDDEAAIDIFHVARNEVMFFEDAVPALERLARRFRLGALSNGNADVHMIGIGRLFDFALSAAEVGRLKPDPAIFEEARRRLGLEPGQIVHVGDDPHTDIWGAAQAGWRTVWVNRNAQTWTHEHDFDAEVDTLSGLEAVIDTWNRA